MTPHQHTDPDHFRALTHGLELARNCQDVPPLHIGPGNLPRAVCCAEHWWLPVQAEVAS